MQQQKRLCILRASFPVEDIQAVDLQGAIGSAPDPSTAARLSLVFWSRFFAWKFALIVVKPATLIGWHRKAFRLFWKPKSRQGRRPIPLRLRQLIEQMVGENPIWGEERIANELWLKLGIRVSPRTVRAYWPSKDPGTFRHSQNWGTFVRNHARGLLACDFVVAVTARFRILYIFVVMEIGSRRILHCNVTPYPTAEWTMQQLREAIPSDHEYRFLIHDRHATFSAELDAAVASLGLKVLKTPVRAPQANAFCERLIGTMGRECLDFIIPLCPPSACDGSRMGFILQPRSPALAPRTGNS